MTLRRRLVLAFAAVAIGTAAAIALATPLVITRGFDQLGFGPGQPTTEPGAGNGRGPGGGQGGGLGPGAGGQRIEEIRGQMIVAIVLVAAGAAIAASLVGAWAAGRLTRPIRELEDAAAAVAGGDLARRSGLAARADELGDLGRSFDGMADSLERGAAERRRFVQDAVHELRTPLTVIEATTSAVLDGVYDHDDAHLRTVRDQARLLARLVDDLRTISLAEEGRLELRREPVDLGAVVVETSRAFEARAIAAGQALRVEATPGGPPVFADVDRVRQVVAALLDNALRHAPPGGSVVAAVVDGTAGRRVEVRDSGPGIADEDLARVFDRLYQGDPSRDRRTGSAGLGLSIVRALVEAHGGRVGAGRAAEGGALVWFELPVVPGA
jgi:two-component system, OmpR family, sensor histidine kinase BaeS